MGLQEQRKTWDYTSRGRCGTTRAGEDVGLQEQSNVWDYRSRGRRGTTGAGGTCGITGAEAKQLLKHKTTLFTVTLVRGAVRWSHEGSSNMYTVSKIVSLFYMED